MHVVVVHALAARALARRRNGPLPEVSRAVSRGIAVFARNLDLSFDVVANDVVNNEDVAHLECVFEKKR